jgi:divalent metal cation (Fe/Co/Zn/Cd) transporter
MLAVNMVRESIGKIFAPTEIVFSVWVIAVLVFSILAKFGLFVFYKLTAKKINSTILSAAAVDSVSDCFATFITLLTFVVGTLFGVNIDGYAGVVVACFIAWSAIGLLKGIFSNLIGKAPDKKMINDIRQRILAFDGVLGVHDLSVYCYGPNKFFASVHIEVSASVDVLVSHELVDLIERDFAENTNIVLTGHLDPIETDNPTVSQLKEVVKNIVLGIDRRFSIHDFRIVQGEKQTNVLFDLSIPYETAINKNAIKEMVEKGIKDYDKKFSPVITVEYGASAD